MSRRKAHLALAFAVVANQLSFVALAAGPTSSTALPTGRVGHAASSCAPGDMKCGPAALAVAVPAGSTACPASGEGAACSSANSAPKVVPGQSFTPEGLSPCASSSNHPALSSAAACTDTLLPATSRGDSIGGSPVTPSVPVLTLRPDPSVQRLDLSVGNAFLQAGEKAMLTATASASVTGTNTAIEIFDQTTHTLVGACSQSSQCSVAYAATSGIHTFAAFVARPSTEPPAANVQSLASNPVSVAWLGVTLKASDSVVGPGKPVMFTATSTFDVSKTGRSIVIYDNTMKRQITYCSRGTTCSTALMLGGVHEIVGLVSGQPQATSQPLTATWLDTAISTSGVAGGTVHLTASANADLTHTPWAMGIYDQRGQLVAPTCKSAICTADIAVPGGPAPSFSAVIGAVPAPTVSTVLGRVLHKVEGPTSLINIQTRSAAVQPQSILWGVDSCRSLTSIYSQTVSRFGKPDFWGRYLTNTGCPGISHDEIAAAQREHIGILPIYNDYNCSSVVGYDAGMQYAKEAASAAWALGIGKGRVLAIDIEPPGAQCPGAVNVNDGFIEGWYDGVAGNGYAPAYYGNGTANSEFSSAWCAAIRVNPAIASHSYLWSFQPSLLGGFSKGNSPGYAPYSPGCGGQLTAWQYQIDSSMSGPSDVDLDEALSTMPLWYP